MRDKIIWSYCSMCRQNTKHDILFEHESTGDYEEYKLYKQMVECLGCENVSYRNEEHDFWNTYEDYEGVEQYQINVEIFPGVLRGHRLLDNSFNIPQSISSVYEQTILAFKAKSLLLAGVGFRAIIEAICIEEKIKGTNLELKINNLAKNRLITERESERLHSIRFLGNDSIHEMEIPKERKLIVVLDIIENLLKNLYIIDKDAKLVLDTIITEYHDFEELLWLCAEKLNLTDERSLKDILGKHIRRIKIDLENIEKIVISRIRSGDIEFLSLVSSKNDPNISSLQLYKFTGKEFDSVPF